MTSAKVIIIGAGRSGTNILRDTLTALPGWETWPCDEINLIWRHGNLDHPDDVLTPHMARRSVSRSIRAAFDKFARASGAEVVVEKTCANALRVPFVDAVLPEARYVYLVRDGRDVARSAAKRWTSKIEPRYLYKKLRYAPVSDIPRYGLRFLGNRLHQARSTDKRMAIWGPIFPEMQTMAREMPLLEVCAAQWAACVAASDAAFSGLTPEKSIRIYYEDLVRAPDETLAKVLHWYDPALDVSLIGDALARIRPQQDDAVRTSLPPEALAIMAPLLKEHGYDLAA